MQSVRCTSSVRIKHSSVFLTVHLLSILCKVFKVSPRIVKHITIKATVCMSVHSQIVCSVCIRRNEVYFYKSKLEDGRVQMHVERLEDNPSELIMSYQTISYHRPGCTWTSSTAGLRGIAQLFFPPNAYSLFHCAGFLCWIFLM